MYSLMSGQGWAKASIPRGAGEIRENQSGHWNNSCDAKRSTSTLWYQLPTCYQHVVCHDNHMAPPEWGEKVNQSQDDSSQLQAVYVPGEELPCPNSTRWLPSKTAPQPVRDVSVVTIWRLWIAPILTPLWRKWGHAILKGCESNCATLLLGEWLVLWSGPLNVSSPKGTVSCGATTGEAAAMRPKSLQ